MRRGAATWILLMAGAVLVTTGCHRVSTGDPAVFPNPAERIRYTPSPGFYTEPCSDASDRVASDFGSTRLEFDPGDLDDFIAAMQSRLDECQTDRRFVLGYLNLLEIGGWSGTYNRTLVEFERQFPGQRHPDPLPDSSATAP